MINYVSILCELIRGSLDQVRYFDDHWDAESGIRLSMRSWYCEVIKEDVIHNNRYSWMMQKGHLSLLDYEGSRCCQIISQLGWSCLSNSDLKLSSYQDDTEGWKIWQRSMNLCGLRWPFLRRPLILFPGKLLALIIIFCLIFAIYFLHLWLVIGPERKIGSK